jgi:hypothetical protein
MPHPAPHIRWAWRLSSRHHPAVAPSIARRPPSNSPIGCASNRLPAMIRSSSVTNSSASGCSWRTRSTNVRGATSATSASDAVHRVSSLQRSGSGRSMRGLRSHHCADRAARNVGGDHVLMHSPREMGYGHAALLTQSLDNLAGSGGPLQVAHIPTPGTTTTTALRP